MTRESVDTKARRYLAEGRVIVTTAGRGVVDATVRGDGAVWTVSYRRGGWYCDCPARGRCCHLVSVGLITAPSTERYGQPATTATRTERRNRA